MTDLFRKRLSVFLAAHTTMALATVGAQGRPAAAAIYADGQDWRGIRGVQLRGYARQVSLTALPRAVRVFGAKCSGPGSHRRGGAGGYGYRSNCANYTTTWWTKNRATPASAAGVCACWWRRSLRRARESGLPEELLERIHTPVGLDLEIAISIIAEIIAAQRGRE
jgi:hypothetical protein